LTFIFIFLILLAYWISRQINYELVSKRLQTDIKERDVFMQSMVHELRAPLTAMRGYASLITESTQVPPVEKQYADRILTSTTRLVNLVNDFLEVAKIQASGLTFKKTSVNIVPVINRSIVDLEGFAKEKQLDLSSNISKNELFIFTDEKRLEQILTNLLSNALKYTKTGRVSISVTEEVKVVKITVADTGVGMDVDGQKKLFAPFVRVGSAEQNANITGTGLGMWITKKLVEQLSGTIGIESISGVGTHVIVTLPKN
jgi:signal transduction histidine kinase